jgi:predicted nucleic acid-binding protein
MAVTTFVDTSVLLAGLIDFGPPSAPAQSILHEIAEKRLTGTATAWHCCLEFYSVATRLPPEFRLAPSDAMLLIEQEIFARFAIHGLPPADRLRFFKNAAKDNTAGGRIYDAHIAEIARASGAALIITDNRRHFLASLRHGLRVETPAEFLATLKTQRNP